MIRKIEATANVAVILTALLVSATTVREHWFPKPSVFPTSVAGSNNILNGKQIALTGVKWSSASETLVMALSTSCHFCEASIPFYRQVSASPAVKAKQVAIVAVFPQDQSDAESFVKQNNIQADNVISTSLQTLGASATPTLLLVDRTGKIRRVWVGVLSPSQQTELLTALNKVS